MTDARPRTPAHGQPVIVTLPAELDIASAGPAGEQLAAALTPGTRVVIADMTATTFCDSMGIGTLVRAHKQATANGIQLRLLRRDPLRLVVPAAHRFARRKSVAIADCRDEAFIGFPGDAGTGTGPLLKRLAAQAGFEPRIAQEAREATTQIGLVAAGLGIAVLPAPLEAVRIEGVHYVPLEGEGAMLVMSVATRSDETSERVLSFVRRVTALAKDA